MGCGSSHSELKGIRQMYKEASEFDTCSTVIVSSRDNRHNRGEPDGKEISIAGQVDPTKGDTTTTDNPPGNPPGKQAHVSRSPYMWKSEDRLYKNTPSSTTSARSGETKGGSVTKKGGGEHVVFSELAKMKDPDEGRRGGKSKQSKSGARGRKVARASGKREKSRSSNIARGSMTDGKDARAGGTAEGGDGDGDGKDGDDAGDAGGGDDGDDGCDDGDSGCAKADADFSGSDCDKKDSSNKTDDKKKRSKDKLEKKSDLFLKDAATEEADGEKDLFEAS